MRCYARLNVVFLLMKRSPKCCARPCRFRDTKFVDVLKMSSEEQKRDARNSDSSFTESDGADRSLIAPLMKGEDLEEEENALPQWEARPGWRLDTLSWILLSVVFIFSTILIICWSFHAIMGHDQNSILKTPPPTRLDRAYQFKADFDIVVSMYREDPAAVNETMSHILALEAVPSNTRVLIYSKDEDLDTAALQPYFPQAEVISLPNIGREGETYLHHILTKWDDLARHTLFTQAGVDDLEEFLHRIDDYYVPSTGMLGLGFVSEVCDCHQCADPYWHDWSGVLAKTYEMANNRTCGWLMLSYKGQFISSAARIRGAGREVYDYLHESLMDPESWTHQPEYLEQIEENVDSMNAPALGFSLERMWGGIMQCADLEVAARCPTMLSGWRRKYGKAEDCQCFDSVPGEEMVRHM